MTRWDWIPHALVLGVALGALYVLARRASRAWGERWLALRRRPRWLQAAVALVLFVLALRIARLGWRPLLAYLGIVAALAAWGEVAVHDLRRVRSSRARGDLTRGRARPYCAHDDRDEGRP